MLLSAAGDLAKLANTGGAAKYLIPGASAITAGLSIHGRRLCWCYC